MLAKFIIFGDSSSGIGALGFDAKAFIIQLITFLLAFWVLKRWAFKPILKVMHDRKETIEKGVSLGIQMEKEQAEMEAKVEKALHETRAKADGIIDEAQLTARETIKAAEDQAKQKAEAIIQGAKDQAKQDTKKVMAELEKETIGLIADTTEAIIHEKVNPKTDAKLIERALKEQRA